MIVDSPRIFGRKGRFFTMKSKVLKRRRKSSRKRIVNNPLIVVVALILIPAVFFGAYYLLNTLLVESRFVVEDIVIEGNEFVPTRMILMAASAEEGDNLFKFDIYGAKKRIEEIPQIFSASVQRKLPDTIVISVIERKARAQIKSRNSERSVCIDSEGVLLPAWASRGHAHITSIEGIELDKVESGTVCDHNLVVSALEVLKLYDNSKLNEQVTLETIRVDGDGEMCITARENVPPRQRLFTVYLGNEELPQRMAYLITILEHEMGPSARHDLEINLTYDRPLSVRANNGHGP